MITTSEKPRNAQIISDHVIAKVQMNESTGQKSLHTSLPFSPGDVISLFSAGTIQSYATYLTVQTGEDRHITLLPEFLQYINHSCDPNAFFNTTTMELECLKAMKPGDEITFFYPSTEWEMSQPFECRCGSKRCLGTINGASHIPVETLSTYKLTDFIMGKLEERGEGEGNKQ